jgi:hypothetical protein
MTGSMRIAILRSAVHETTAGERGWSRLETIDERAFILLVRWKPGARLGVEVCETPPHLASTAAREFRWRASGDGESLKQQLIVLRVPASGH